MRIAVTARAIYRTLNPMDLLEVHTIFMLEQTADEDRGCHGVKRHADALAFQILGRPDAGFLVDGDEAVAEAARGKHRQRDERTLLVGEALYEFRRGIFRYVE